MVANLCLNIARLTKKSVPVELSALIIQPQQVNIFNITYHMLCVNKKIPQYLYISLQNNDYTGVINMFRLNRVINKQRCIAVALQNYCSL